MSRLVRAALATALTLVPGVAFAHVGVGDTHGFAHGFMHPIGGLDHVLAMVGVGLFAARLGGRALWLVPLAFVATMPLGAVLGSLFESPRSMGLVMVPLIGLIAISGIFYPITAMPGWLQGIAQVFPVYWLGLGMRSAFLPDALAAVELTGSWRHLETVGVLAVWAVLGLVLAPVILRRMARRESGSAVAARRERVLTTTIR